MKPPKKYIRDFFLFGLLLKDVIRREGLFTFFYNWPPNSKPVTKTKKIPCERQKARGGAAFKRED